MGELNNLLKNDLRIDHLNELFLSNKITDIYEFFENFSKTEDLVAWMKNRPKQAGNLYINDYGTKCVVVIPTKDIRSKYALNCKYEIFKGISQIFIESKKPFDPFFNFSKNVNDGVKRALNLNANWIIISNDDMYKIDPPERLISKLSFIDSNKYDALFTIPPGEYHSFYRILGTPNKLYRSITKLHPNRVRKKRADLWEKYGVSYIDAINDGLTGSFTKLTYSNKKKHLLTGSFFILSASYADSVNGNVLDDTFINGGEDTDLSLRIESPTHSYGYINYRIGDLIGGSMGRGWPRIFRNIVNEVYLNYKITNGLIEIYE